MKFDYLLEIFETFLAKNFQKTCYPRLFEQAISYSILDGGKRLRPLFYLVLWQALQRNSQEILPFAAATECIHSYALVHDDLPCMDDDDYRRGKPSNHKKFGEANAILTGDALLTEAFAIIFNHSHSAFASRVVLAATKTMTYHAKMMLAGQFLDINVPQKFANKQASYDYLHTMEKRKTAYLFQSCFEIPAILAELKNKETLKELGTLTGICYQIKDDILDANSERKQINQAKNVITFSSLLGVKEATNILSSKKKKIQQLIESLPFKTTQLCEVIEFALEL